MLRFRDITATSGLDFQYASETFRGGGLAVADLDGDGLPEVVASRREGGLALFHNRGGLSFEPAAASGLDLAWPVTAIAAADLDNDGDADLVLASTGVAYVMSNHGDGTFSLAATLPGSGRTEQVLPVDIDGDGRLDLYFSNYDLVDKVNSQNRLYMSVGGLEFAAATVASGMTWTATAFDVDRDGDQDLYVAHDTLLVDFGRPVATSPSTSSLPPDLLLRNDGLGSGPAPVLTDVASTLGLTTPRSSMGGVLGDFDDDGQLDLYVPNDGANKLFLRDAAGGFVESAVAYGVDGTFRINDTCGPDSDDENCLLLSWSAALSDFDLDGYDELLVVNGVTGPGTSVPPVLMFTRGTSQRFHEVAPDIACIDARGLVVTDLDGDGDQDVAIAQNNGPLMVYENRGTPAPGSWLRVQLLGAASNRDGIGAVVTLDMSSGRRQMRVVGSGGVINSASPAEAFFGLGGDTIEQIVVHWPSGRSSTVQRPQPGGLLIQEQ